MNLCASGINATIDLHAHHLVINRLQPGILFGASDAEHLIPYSSIKSVQFVRPGLLSPGKIVLILASGSTVRPGSLNDPNTVLFTKKQLALFESVLRAIQNAIATPSIERLAMAAQQQRSIDSNQPTPESGELQRINPPSEATGRSGHGDGSATYGSQQPTNGIAASPKPKSWWGDMPLLGKVILVIFGTLFLLSTCNAITSGPDSASQTESEQTAPSSSDGLAADQMLSDWADFVTGSASTDGFGLTNGKGQPGEFCSASSGTVLFRFGGQVFGDHPVHDYFAKMQASSNEGTAGAFWFERAANTLLARNLAKFDDAGNGLGSIPDQTMTVAQVSPGIVEIDGTPYHHCIL